MTRCEYERSAAPRPGRSSSVAFPGAGRFGSEVLMDVLRTHPRVIVDDMVHDNPYYVEPGKYLARRP